MWECKEEDICGGSLNTIWAGGALRDTEVEVQCGYPVGGRQQQDHHGVGGQLIIFHNTRWRDVVEEERKSLREESTPEGWFFLKNSERMFRKSESEK